MAFSFGSGNVDPIEIEVTSETEGLDETLHKLRQVGEQLVKIQKTLQNPNLNKGLQSIFGKQQAEGLEYAEKMQAQSLLLIKKQTEELKKQKQVVTEIAQAQKKASGTFSRGFGSSAADQKDFKSWQKDIKSWGSVMNDKPKNLTGALANMKSLKTSLTDISRAGIATKTTLDSIGTGISSSFAKGFSSTEKMRLSVGILRKDLDSLFFNLHDKAKNTQWTGRQMLEGITLPIVGVGTAAVQSFDRVNREMLQLKKVTKFAEDYNVLKEEIRDIGKEYGMVDSIVTGLYTDIAAMGVPAEQIKSWASSIAKLSMLGDIDMSTATNMFRVINSTFANGDADLTQKYLEQINAVADDASIQLKDLAASIPQVAPVMKELGFDAAGTAITLASMYKRGIDATEAAHALKFSLMSIVNPTKKAKDALEEIGFNYFGDSLTTADAKLAILAQKFAGLDHDANLQHVGDIFGKRQAARMLALFDDMNVGLRELQAANADGLVSLEDTKKFTSDYARTMVSSGKIATAEMDKIMSAGERYNRAWAEFQKDPSIGLAKLKAQLKSILVDLGGEILPPLLNAGQRIADVFEKMANMPAPIKKLVGAILLLAASFGPVLYVTAQAEHALASFGSMAAKVLPKAFKELSHADVAGLFDKDKDRKDIGQIGDQFVQFKGKRKGGATSVDSETFKATLGEKKFDDAIEDSNRSLVKQLGLEERIARLSTKKAEARKAVGGYLSSKFDTLPKNIHAEDIKLLDEKIKKTRSLAQVESLMFQKTIQKNGIQGLTKHPVRAQATDDLLKLKKTREELVKLNDAANNKRNIKGGILGILGDLGGRTASIGKLFMMFSKFTVIAAPIIAIGLAFSALFKDLDRGWQIILKAITPAIQSLHKAFDKVIGAVKEISEKFMGVVTSVDSGGGGDKLQSFWNMLGQAASAAINIIAKGLELLAKLIRWLWPVFEGLGYAVKNVFGFISSLIHGDAKSAFMYFVAFAYEAIRPVIMLFDQLWKAAVSCVQGTLGAFINFPLIGGFVKSVTDSLEDFKKKSLTGYLDDTLRNLPKQSFGDGSGGASSGGTNAKANNAGQAAADSFTDGFGKQLDKNKSKMADWFGDFLSAVKSRLDKVMGNIRDSATKAFDEMQKKEMQYYDDKLKALDDIEEAENRLYEEQEYLEKKKEMLYKRGIDVQNYQRNRALAIYEGRIDDARMLDLDEKRNKHDFDRDYRKMEEDRRRALVKQARDGQRKIIGIEKDGLEKRQAIQKEAFEKMLAEITEYTPRTIAEMQGMMDNVNALLFQNNVVGWPMMAQTGGALYLQAIQQANEDIRQDFAWSGNASITSWIAAFAAPDVIGILLQKGKDVKDTVDSGMTGLGKSPLDGMLLDTEATTDGMGGAFGKLFDDISNAWNGVGTDAQNSMEDTFDFGNEMMADFAASFASAAIDMANGFRMIGNTIFMAIVHPLNVVIDMINRVIGGLFDKLPNFAKNALGWHSNSFMIPIINHELFKYEDPNAPLRVRAAQQQALDRVKNTKRSKQDTANYRAYEAFKKAGADMNAIKKSSTPQNLPTSSGAIVAKGASSVAGKAAEAAGTNIYVDTAIGEDEWFKQNMKQWDKNVGNKAATAQGSQKRVIGTYNENNRGKW